MKIEEALYRMISFNNVELPKKAAAVLPEQIPNVDSYTASSEALEEVEQEVFQVLKDITRDLMGSIGNHEADNENGIVTGNAGIDRLKLAGLPLPQSDILVLLVSRKGEAPENPLKIIIAYKTGEPLEANAISVDMAKNDFIDAVVESAKKYIGVSTGNNLIPATGGKSNTASEDEMGYIVRFPYVSHMQIEGEVLRSMAAKGGVANNLWQPLPPVVPDVVNIAQVESTNLADFPIESIWKKSTHSEGIKSEGVDIEGEVIDGKALMALFRSVGDDKELFEKLSAFAVGTEKDTSREGTKSLFPANPLYVVVIHIDPAKIDDTMIPVGPDRLSAHAFQGRAGRITESIKDDVTREMISGTAFSGQEISKSPLMNSSITSTSIPATNIFNAPADNDVVLERLALFVDRVNVLLDGDATIDEASGEAPTGAEPGSISDKLHLLQLQRRDAGIGPVVQTAVKKIIFENEEFQKAQMIGLSIEKSNLLRLDRPTIEGAFASNKEETLNTLKGLGSSLYERINYFVHPYAGIYADNKEVLQLRASQKDEGALLLDKQLNKEQGGLEKRLNELQLLIERSTLVKQWFAEDNATQTEDNT